MLSSSPPRETLATPARERFSILDTLETSTHEGSPFFSRDSKTLNPKTLCTRQVMNDFQAAERKHMEEPVMDIGLEHLCALVNNNVRCYDLSKDLSENVMHSLSDYYAEQVGWRGRRLPC